MQFESASIGHVLEYVISGAVALLVWAVKLIYVRLARLEKCMVTKAQIQHVEENSVNRREFDAFMQRAEASRIELRQAQLTLFEKIDGLKSLIMDMLREVRK
jgi:hypothetical protein